METYVPQNEKESRMPGGKSEALSLSEILQTRRVGSVGWSAPLELKRSCRGWIGLSESSNGGNGEGRTVVQSAREEAGSMERGDFIHGGKTRTSGLVKREVLPRQYKMGGGNGVVQMEIYGLGCDIKKEADLENLKAEDSLVWPTSIIHTAWKCVDWALNWALTASEGNAGWFNRMYSKDEFLEIVDAINNAVGNLPSVKPLDNENNRTLIAIRAFRSAHGVMAQETWEDLKHVYDIVKHVQSDLVLNGFIWLWNRLLSIEAELGEAHPNTLPTARVVFGGKTLYFKGRTSFVEGILVGMKGSVARNLSERGTHKYPVGKHRFAGNHCMHLAEAVAGTKYQESVVSGEEKPGIKKQKAVRAWMSMVKTSLLASVTGSNDMHKHNILKDGSDVAHIIDGEFLLDVRQWEQYTKSIQDASFYNISNIIDLAEGYLKSLLKDFSDEEVKEVKDMIILEFNSLNLGNREVLDRVLKPVQELTQKEVLLRTMPRGTEFWLNGVTDYNNAPDDYTTNVIPDNHSEKGDREAIANGFEASFDLLDTAKASGELIENYKKGMVPVFHVGAASGDLYMNKYLVIGHVKEGRSVADFLEYLKTEFAGAVNDGRIGKLIAKIFDNYAPKAEPEPMADSSAVSPSDVIPNPFKSELETSSAKNDDSDNDY